MPHPGPRIPLLLAALLCLAANPGVGADAPIAGELGLPYTRFYSYDEIGNVSRGVRLGFDPLGRIAVIRAGACVVLNDTTWTDISAREDNNPAMEYLVFGQGGEAYYSAFGTWGSARIHQGKLRPTT